ncbi:MAG: ABC transporter ATP-binding protein [Kiritimatiellaeota bacterium]|nr:ABC transporter ATP-binding protein [Kiritimatiellota bacterium]
MTGGADVMLTNVTRTYRPPNGVPTEVLRGVDLHVAAGETLAVTGPSGSGKTTLLQIIGALDCADGGDVRVNGRELGTLGETARAQFRNREIGFVFQAHHLLPQLTALENVLVPAWAARHVEEERKARAHHLLERVGLQDRLAHFPGQLSGGEQQRVAIARALIMSPCLLLADEPTGALDHEAAQSLMDLLLQLNRDEGATLILVTHSAACAERMSRRTRICNGRIRQD